MGVMSSLSAEIGDEFTLSLPCFKIRAFLMALN